MRDGGRRGANLGPVQQQFGGRAAHVEARLEGGLIKGFALVGPADDSERRARMQAAPCGDRAGISGSFCESLATDRPHMRQGNSRVRDLTSEGSKHFAFVLR